MDVAVLQVENTGDLNVTLLEQLVFRKVNFEIRHMDFEVFLEFDPAVVVGELLLLGLKQLLIFLPFPNHRQLVSGLCYLLSYPVHNLVLVQLPPLNRYELLPQAVHSYC